MSLPSAIRVAPLALLLTACGGGSSPSSSETPTAPDEADAAAAPRNVLVTLIDTAAAGHLALYGYERDTMPFLTRLADECWVFEDTSAPSAYTLASVATVFSGASTELHRVSVPGDVLPPRKPTLAEVFQEAGFHTTSFSTNAHIIADFGFDRGFDFFQYVPIDLRDDRRMEIPEPVMEAIDEFLADGERDPFFAYWHFLPPHAPYAPPDPYPAVYADHLPDLSLARSLWHATGSANLANFTAEEIASLNDLYDSALRYTDSLLERIHAGLEASGLLDETLWIIVSDHGEAIGEHNTLQHRTSVYQELIHVPLLMRFPGGGSGVIEEPVGLVDLFPTLMELYDFEAPSPPSGRSLLPLLEGGTVERKAGFFLNSTPRSGWTGLRRDRFKLVRQSNKRSFTLFDLDADPLETTDVAAEHPEVFESMRKELLSRFVLWDPENRDGPRAAIDPEVAEQLRAIGYAEDLESDQE